jgi:hypothetical protein
LKYCIQALKFRWPTQKLLWPLDFPPLSVLWHLGGHMAMLRTTGLDYMIRKGLMYEPNWNLIREWKREKWCM